MMKRVCKFKLEILNLNTFEFDAPDCFKPYFSQFDIHPPLIYPI